MSHCCPPRETCICYTFINIKPFANSWDDFAVGALLFIFIWKIPYNGALRLGALWVTPFVPVTCCCNMNQKPPWHFVAWNNYSPFSWWFYHMFSGLGQAQMILAVLTHVSAVCWAVWSQSGLLTSLMVGVYWLAVDIISQSVGRLGFVACWQALRP